MSGTNASMGFRPVALVTRGLGCPCCRDRRTKREIRRTARRVAKQRDAADELTRMREAWGR